MLGNCTDILLVMWAGTFSVVRILDCPILGVLNLSIDIHVCFGMCELGLGIYQFRQILFGFSSKDDMFSGYVKFKIRLISYLLSLEAST